MRYLLIVVLLSMVLLSGCTEEEQAEAKELWLGIPDRTPPKTQLLAAKEEDSPAVRAYKEKAAAARADEYSRMSGKKAMRLFAEKADSLDMNNIRDLLYAVARPVQVDNRFEKDLALRLPPPERRYTPMDFNTSAYGDMHRAAGSMQDLGASMMQQAAIEAERKAIGEAREAINSYALHMEQVKLSLVRQPPT